MIGFRPEELFIMSRSVVEHADLLPENNRLLPVISGDVVLILLRIERRGTLKCLKRNIGSAAAKGEA